MNQWQNIQSYLDRLDFAIAEKAPKNTGDLAKSITSTITQKNDNGFTVEVSMLEYGIFQDKGVNGIDKKWGSPFSFRNKKPPHSLFASYTNSISGQYAIATSIYYNGIKPKHFIEPALNKHLEDLANFACEDLWDYWYQQNK
jgi:hypothetical protein